MTPYQLTTLYVSQKEGDDACTGFCPTPSPTRQGPLKTLEKALSCVEDMRRSGIKQPVTIRITDPVYLVSRPIVINEKMYGITIDSQKGCTVSGGRKIEGFRKDTFMGRECFSAPVPQIADGLWFTDLYVNGLRADMPHYPVTGTLDPESVENEDADLGASSSWFVAQKKDREIIGSFRNFEDCIISFNHYWVDEHTPIASYDAETGKVTFALPSRFSVSSKQAASALHYIIENTAETFGNPNEWYLDRETKRVYYIPRDESMTPETLDAYAPLTDKLFEIVGSAADKVRNISFRNLTFACTRGDRVGEMKTASDSQAVSTAPGAVSFRHAANCEMTECTFRNLGLHAVGIAEGCHGIRVTCNEFYDLGAGALTVNGGAFGSDPAEHTYGNVISDNVIHHCGRRYFSACGILIRHAYENTVSHNDIYDLYYTGISVGWVWGYGDSITRDNLIEANHIHTLGQGKLSDMGGIYLLGAQPGTVVRGNLIHDIVSAHYGGWGIYTDEGSSFITVEDNVCYRLNCNAYHQHYGSMNTVRNNIFFRSADAPVALTRNEYHVGLLLERNILVSNGTPIYQPGSKDYGFYGSVHLIAADRNLLYDEKGDVTVLVIGEKAYSAEEAQREFGLEKQGITADPGLDTETCTLRKDSEAYDVGFRDVDMRDVGARNRRKRIEN